MSESTESALLSLYRDQETIFDEAYKAADDDEPYEGQDADEFINEAIYGVEVVRHVEITLAGGGPSAILDIILDGDNYVRQVEWQGSWASTSLTRQVYEGQALWRLAERFAETQ